MSTRSTRRAAERRKKKLARKAALQAAAAQLAPESSIPSLPPVDEPKPISQSRLAANRANAQLSTGPKTADGKAKTSLNAVKTGLTGHTVLLPGDDAAAYEQHLRDYEHELQPVGPLECALVQSLADTAWRLDRIPGLEMAIFAQGSIQFANLFDDHEPSLRPGLIELHTFLTYEKQLRNLQLQEARLHRRREKDSAELRNLQKQRDRREREQLETAAKLYTAAKHDGKPFDSAEFGFEFSNEAVEAYLERVRAANLLNASLKQEYFRASAHAKAA